MSDNMLSNVQLNTNANGTVSFATDVVATIASLAATEIDGVACMYSGSGNSFTDILTRRSTNSRNLTKGVKVEMLDGKVKVDVTICVEYGSPVPDVARGIQENVKKAIETMSGLNVEAVDVHVQSVSFERERQAVAEIEQQQRLLLQKQQEGERAERAKNDPVEQLRKEEYTAEEPNEYGTEDGMEPISARDAEDVEEVSVSAEETSVDDFCATEGVPQDEDAPAENTDSQEEPSEEETPAEE